MQIAVNEREDRSVESALCQQHMERIKDNGLRTNKG